MNNLDWLRERFMNYDAGALRHLYWANSMVLEQDRQNVEKMTEIVQLLKEELERRGLGGDLPQDTNAI